MLLVSALLAILFGLQGCWYSKMTHFDEDDLKWVEWANVGDSLLFRSDSGIIDTWIISEVHVYDIHNPIVFFNVDPGVFEANAAYYMENSKDKMLSGALFICKKEKEDSLYICAYLQGRFLKKVTIIFRQCLLSLKSIIKSSRIAWYLMIQIPVILLIGHKVV